MGNLHRCIQWLYATLRPLIDPQDCPSTNAAAVQGPHETVTVTASFLNLADDSVAVLIADSGVGGGSNGNGSGGNAPSSGTTCPAVPFKITGIAPGQAPGTTAISQTPRAGIPNGGVAIKPGNFGVAGINGSNRSVFLGMTFTVNWSGTTVPSGIPTQGPFFPVDNIGPASVRNAPRKCFRRLQLSFLQTSVGLNENGYGYDVYSSQHCGGQMPTIALCIGMILMCVCSSAQGQNCALSGTKAWNSELRNIVADCPDRFSSPDGRFVLRIGNEGVLSLWTTPGQKQFQWDAPKLEPPAMIFLVS